MLDVHRRVGIRSTLEKVFEAIATVEGLSRWWSTDTTGEVKPGGSLRFRFDGGGFDIKVLELKPNELVKWKCVDGPKEWVGTDLTFRLRSDNGQVYRPLHPCEQERARGVHAPLQHDMGHVPVEPEGRA